MIATTAIASALAVSGGVAVGVVVVLGDSRRSRAFPQERYIAAEDQSASLSSLGFAECSFDGARRTRKLHLAHIGDVLVFRTSDDPKAELEEMVPLRNMQASSVAPTTIEIEAGFHSVRLKVDDELAAEKLLSTLKEAAVLSDTVAERMATVREALASKDKDKLESNVVAKDLQERGVAQSKELKDRSQMGQQPWADSPTSGSRSVLCINHETLSAEAKAYLFEYRLAERLSQALEATLRQRPRDPASFIADRLRRSEVPCSPSLRSQDVGSDEAEVDSPRLAFMQLAINSPTWRSQSPIASNTSPIGSSTLTSPTLAMATALRFPNIVENAAG